MKATVNPDLLVWARERADLDVVTLAGRMGVVAERVRRWEEDGSLTLKQLEALAKVTHTSVGYLFLSTPPGEELPIPDYRTLANEPLKRPSANLLDVVRACQQRQSWFREYLQIEGGKPLGFVGSVRIGDDVKKAAANMLSTLDFSLDARRTSTSWEAALRCLVDNAERVGVLVMASGVVGNNTHRKLEPSEFRGFAMSDPLAPLVFINAADSKAAQIFTLTHELVHIWAGASALSGVPMTGAQGHDVERWCNKVAAELLVPEDVLRMELAQGASVNDLNRLAHTFKVSSLVVLIRLYEIGAIRKSEFDAAYAIELQHAQRPASGGGNFYFTEAARVGRRFARALIADTLGGRTLFRDAFQLLSITKIETFHNLAQRLETAR